MHSLFHLRDRAMVCSPFVNSCVPSERLCVQDDTVQPAMSELGREIHTKLPHSDVFRRCMMGNGAAMSQRGKSFHFVCSSHSSIRRRICIDYRMG